MLWTLTIIDNGIFYGTVQNLRFFQSLIMSRRDGTLSPDTEAVANRIYETLRYALRAWWARHRADNLFENPNVARRRIASAFVPALHSELVREGRIRPSSDWRSDVGIDIDVVLQVGASPDSEQEVFTDASSANVDARGRDENRADSALPA